MKRILLLFILAFNTLIAFGQVLPSSSFGLKGGGNYVKFDTKAPFASDNSAGYYAGLWTRIGAAGLHLQPELYLSGKHTKLKNDSGFENDVKFTSLDVPVLIGTKIGAVGVGLRLNTGPVASFILNKDQHFDDAAANVFNGDFKDQNFAWQFGAGLDVGKLSVDLRYEMGLSKLNSAGYPDTKLNLFTFGIGLKLF